MPDGGNPRIHDHDATFSRQFDTHPSGAQQRPESETTLSPTCRPCDRPAPAPGRARKASPGHGFSPIVRSNPVAALARSDDLPARPGRGYAPTRPAKSGWREGTSTTAARRGFSVKASVTRKPCTHLDFHKTHQPPPSRDRPRSRSDLRAVSAVAYKLARPRRRCKAGKAGRRAESPPLRSVSSPAQTHSRRLSGISVPDFPRSSGWRRDAAEPGVADMVNSTRGLPFSRPRHAGG